MPPKSHYHKLRSQYQPTHIKLVFLLESPLASGKYFYDPTGKRTEPLFSALMKVIGENPVTKHEGLTVFQAKGFFLVDATYQPVNHIKSDKERNQAIRDAFPELIDDLRRTLPDRRTPIVLVKANICRLLEARLKQEDFNVINEGTVIPFPSSGQQAKFHRAIQELFYSATDKVEGVP
jgi:hypothetical protein